jgi:arylsulfatase A
MLRVLGLLFCVILSGSQVWAADPPRQPNFVVIMADDLGYGDLSPYGGRIKVPHLEKLAAEGMQFSDFHSSGNVCSPTRAGLMTGRYQQRAGIPGVVFADPQREAHLHGLQTGEVTFAELLKEAGYSTGMFGKWHLGYFKKYNPIHHGFDQFRGYVSGNVDFFSHIDQAGSYDWWHQDQHAQEDGYVTHLITQHAVSFIRSHKDKPFCLYLPHEAPHYPYQGPNDSAERTVGNVKRTTGSRDDIRKAYREMVEEMDKGVGEVMTELKKQGLAENTLVLFFSDNGANKNGNNGSLRGSKGSNWEGGHRVPCIARWPGRIKAGSKNDDLAISLDVMPTLLDAAGVAVPKGHKLDGVSLLPTLTGQKPLGDRQLVWNGQAIRDGQWKLVVNGKGSKGTGLYDLSKDIGEKTNLAASEQDRVSTMRAALEAWKTDVANGATQQPVAEASP